MRHSVEIQQMLAGLKAIDMFHSSYNGVSHLGPRNNEGFAAFAQFIGGTLPFPILPVYWLELQC